MFLPKKGQKKSNIAQFAWKLLEVPPSGEIVVSEDESPVMILHLKAIFLSLDSDNDDLLTRPQLVEAIQLSGLQPRDSLIKKYAAAMSESGSETNSFSLTQENVIIQPKRKNTVVAPLFFKTDMRTFIKVTKAELFLQNSVIEEEVANLFDFFSDSTCPCHISVKHIRHVLNESLAPTKLSVLETAEYLKSAKLLPAGNISPSTNESQILIPSKLLAHSMLVGYDSLNGVEQLETY